VLVIKCMRLICCDSEDDDLLVEPCMANVKKASKKVECAVNKLKKARSRMKVFTTDVNHTGLLRVLESL